MSCSCECGQPRRPMACGCACQCACSCERDDNRPGLDAVRYRDGAYDAALLRMRERLSGSDLPGLRALTARAVDEAVDPAIALLDSWACLSEILSFYNERSVNESFLRTCTERRSALELARLVGYAPRPGVAADAYLAFTLDDVNKEAVFQVPTGTRAYSQPEPGETMQPFETDEALTGRPRWSAMRPRQSRPQVIKRGTSELWFKGITTGLVPGSLLIFELGSLRLGQAVSHVDPLPAKDRTREVDRTRVEMQRPRVDRPDSVNPTPIELSTLERLVAQPSLHTTGREQLVLEPGAIFTDASYAPVAMLGSAYPGLGETLADALRGTTPNGPTGKATVYAMRIKAALHGHNAPLFPDIDDEGRVKRYLEWTADGADRVPRDEDGGNGDDVDGDDVDGDDGTGDSAPLLPVESCIPLGKNEIALDAVYDQIVPGSLIAIVYPNPVETSSIKPISVKDEDIYIVREVKTVSRVCFNLPARVTQLTLNRNWPREGELDPGELRRITVYAQSEALELAEQPIPDVVAGDEMVLDGYYPGLQPGRRLIVTGERADLAGITGVRGTELVIIEAVAHRSLPTDGWATMDTIHTYLTLEPGLKYLYKRDTATIYGNVAHATHGESRAEVLGSGDATRPLQVFPLKQTPLTYVSAPTPSGIENTLEVHVNDLRWREAPNPAAVGSEERRYVLRTDDEAKTSVITGLGARLPTGRDNVRAVYRSGIGSAGNVKSGQISVLASRPNGVMGVTNPLATSGGADRDDLEQIRTRTPIGLTALERLISAADFVDFSRAFAGIGKAGVACTGAGGASVSDCATGVTKLTLTVAGEDDIPIALNSNLVRNLRKALIRYGDLMLDTTVDPPVLRTRNTPQVTVEIRIRDARLIAIRARIRLLPDYLWEKVLPAIEAALIARFGFDARELGQALDPGAVIATIHKVRGVAYVDLQKIGVIDPGTVEQPKLPAEIAKEALDVLGDPVLTNMPPIAPMDPSQIAYIAQNAAGTLLLTPWEDTGP